MDYELIANIIGILGFIFGLVTFIITRWERRSRIEFEVFLGDSNRIEPSTICIESNSSNIIGIRIINTGHKSVVIDRNSFLIKSSENKSISLHHTDWLGIDNIPSPFNPNSSFEIGIFQDVFEDTFYEEKFEEFMSVEDYKNCEIKIDISFKSNSGKVYSSGFKFTYSFYVNEFFPAQHIGS